MTFSLQAILSVCYSQYQHKPPILFSSGFMRVTAVICLL